MSFDWIMQVPSIVYSRLTNEFSQKILDNFKMTKGDNFSSDGDSTAPTAFPFVSLEMLTPTEQGQTLEGTSINGGLFTFQIDVYDNKSKQNSKTVMTEVVRIMKTMRFNIIGMPTFDDSDKTFRGIARFQRVIGAGDIL